MRIGRTTDALGARGHGPVHAPDHRIWNSGRGGRWSGALSDVQAGDSRCNDSSQIPQFGSRPAVSISSVGVGSEPAGLVEQVKTVPYVPLSHPFIERLIGTLRRECLDQLLFWTATDLQVKLIALKDYFN